MAVLVAIEIAIIIRMILINGVLTAMVDLVYSLVVAGTTTALQTQNNAFLAALVLGLASYTFIPASHRLTPLVNRYLPYMPPSAKVVALKAAGE